MDGWRDEELSGCIMGCPGGGMFRWRVGWRNEQLDRMTDEGGKEGWVTIMEKVLEVIIPRGRSNARI